MGRLFVAAILTLLLSCTHTAKVYVQDHFSAIDQIGESVYRIGDSKGWGTGFAVKAGSGKTVILTNDHVCDGLDKRDTARLRAGGKAWKVKIIARYAKHDLCMLKAPKGAKALGVGSGDMAEYREKVYTAGYPVIPDMTERSGVALSLDKQPTQYPLPPAECKGEKYRIENKLMMVGPGMMLPIPVCLMTSPFQNTSVESDEGASGSPVVNEDKEVVGVISTVIGRIGYAQMVPLSYVKDFLSEH